MSQHVKISAVVDSGAEADTSLESMAQWHPSNPWSLEGSPPWKNGRCQPGREPSALGRRHGTYQAHHDWMSHTPQAVAQS